MIKRFNKFVHEEESDEDTASIQSEELKEEKKGANPKKESKDYFKMENKKEEIMEEEILEEEILEDNKNEDQNDEKLNKKKIKEEQVK